MSNAIIDCRWTSDADQKFIRDWQLVENTVFGIFNDEMIDRKYFKNIYGPSVLAIAYLDDVPVGADALWRNDINGEETYFSSDTCVLPVARGKGVMTGLIQAKMSLVPKDVSLYGSPNAKSYGGFVKKGWKDLPLYKGILTLPIFYTKEYPDFMPNEYAKWWIVGENKYHLKRFGHYYLVSSIPNKKYIMNLIAEVDEQTAMCYPRYKGFALYIYRTKNKPLLPLLNKVSYNHISWNGDPSIMPYWKVDGYCE